MKHNPTRSQNIYKEGNSYRVIKHINGVRISRSFPKYRLALDFKQDLLNANA